MRKMLFMRATEATHPKDQTVDGTIAAAAAADAYGYKTGAVVASARLGRAIGEGRSPNGGDAHGSRGRGVGMVDDSTGGRNHGRKGKRSSRGTRMNQANTEGTINQNSHGNESA